jgi:hypothetical protein
MKEIIGRASELKSFHTILGNWLGEKPLWIHFHGEPGSGKTYLIRSLFQKKLSGIVLLWQFDYELFHFDENRQINHLLHHIHREFRSETESFLKRYPRYLRSAILELFEGRTRSSGVLRFSSQFLNELLLQVLDFFSSKKRKPLIVVENVNFQTNSQIALLHTILSNPVLPIVIITTGKDVPPPLYDDKFVLISLNKLSPIDIQNFIRDYLDISESNARFITNQLQIKSQGLPAQIKFLLETYYRDIVPKDPSQFIDASRLQQIRISMVPEVLFQNLLKRLSAVEINFLAFLSRLIDPLPLKMFEQISRSVKLTKGFLPICVERGYLKEEDFLGERFVFVEWEELREFLRKQSEIPAKAMKRIMDVLKNDSALKNPRFPLQLSHIYFELGEKETAFRLAHQEARLLITIHLKQRAYERYNFLKRNLADYPGVGKNHEAVLQEIGELQESLGLYENAFESFRELRDLCGKGDQQTWFKVGLQMAGILLKMDAFAEARYLLNDLKIKKAADVHTKSFALVLLGDLDRNLGQNAYALKKYEKALSMLEGQSAKLRLANENQELIFQVYSKIRRMHLTTGNGGKIKEFALEATRLMRKGSRNHQLVRLDLLKYLMDKRELNQAHELSFKLLREIKENFDASIMAQTVLYLVEIYAYYSKWYLARSHLRELVQLRLFFTAPKVQARMVLDLAVIEKEIARYGAALKLLSEAEEICRSEGFSYEQNEIRIHKGHIQLLIHGYLRQREFLGDALQWALENHAPGLFVAASLYMSFYELKHGRVKKAKKHLDEARAQIKQNGSEIDKLNYMFYLLHYLFKIERYAMAEKIVCILKEMSHGIAKFENLATWFEAKLLFARGDFKKSLALYELSLEKSRRYHIPYTEFHILKEIVILCYRGDMKKEMQKFTTQLKSAFKKLLAAIDDEIFQKQFGESREVGELAEIGIVLESETEKSLRVERTNLTA